MSVLVLASVAGCVSRFELAIPDPGVAFENVLVVMVSSDDGNKPPALTMLTRAGERSLTATFGPDDSVALLYYAQPIEALQLGPGPVLTSTRAGARLLPRWTASRFSELDAIRE